MPEFGGAWIHGRSASTPELSSPLSRAYSPATRLAEMRLTPALAAPSCWDWAQSSRIHHGERMKLPPNSPVPRAARGLSHQTFLGADELGQAPGRREIWSGSLAHRSNNQADFVGRMRRGETPLRGDAGLPVRFDFAGQKSDPRARFWSLVAEVHSQLPEPEPETPDCAAVEHLSSLEDGALRSALSRGGLDLLGPASADTLRRALGSRQHFPAAVSRTARMKMLRQGFCAGLVAPSMIDDLFDDSAQRAETRRFLDELELKRHIAQSSEAAPPGRSVPELLNKLLDKDAPWREKQAAAEALGNQGSVVGQAASEVARGLEDTNQNVRAATAGALKRLSLAEGVAAVPELAQRLADGDRSVRNLARVPLQELRSSGVLREPGAAAVDGHSLLQPPGGAEDQALPIFLVRLTDEDWRVRQAAAEALGHLGAAASAAGAAPALAKALADNSWKVRVAARNALEIVCAAKGLLSPAVAGAGAAVELVPLLSHEDWWVRHSAVGALAHVGGMAAAGAPELIHALGDHDAKVRHMAVEALGLLGLPAAGAFLEIAERLEDRRPEVRDAAKIALGRIVGAVAASEQSLSASPAVTREILRLEDPDRLERISAAKALGEFGPSVLPVVSVLMSKFLDDKAGGDVMAAVLQSLRSLHQCGLLVELADVSPLEKPLKFRPKLLILLKDVRWEVRLGAAVAVADLVDFAGTVVGAITRRMGTYSIDTPGWRLLRQLQKAGALVDLHDIASKAIAELAAVFKTIGQQLRDFELEKENAANKMAPILEKADEGAAEPVLDVLKAVMASSNMEDALEWIGCRKLRAGLRTLQQLADDDRKGPKKRERMQAARLAAGEGFEKLRRIFEAEALCRDCRRTAKQAYEKLLRTPSDLGLPDMSDMIA